MKAIDEINHASFLKKEIQKTLELSIERLKRLIWNYKATNKLQKRIILTRTQKIKQLANYIGSHELSLRIKEFEKSINDPNASLEDKTKSIISSFIFMYDYVYVIIHRATEPKTNPISVSEFNDSFNVNIFDQSDITQTSLGNQLNLENINTKTFKDKDDLIDALHKDMPHIMILSHPEKNENNEILKKIEFEGLNTERKTQIIYFGCNDSFDERLISTTYNVDYFFNHKDDISDLCHLIIAAKNRTKEPNYRILIIDDDPQLSDYYQNILNRANMTSHILNNPKSCFREIEQFAPDLILIKSSMKDITGVEIAKVIRQRYLFNQIPIIFITHDKKFDRTILSHNFATDEYILKPFHPNSLITTIGAKVASSRNQTFLKNSLKNSVAKAQKLEQQAIEAASHKASFLANMSHEIRTPLNGILGAIQLLEQENLPKSAIELTKIQKSSSKVLMVIINDILDLSKIESGNMTLENEPFSLEEVSNEILELFDKPASEKEIILSLLLDPRIPKTLLADDTRIRQVLINLINNAIKFTKSGMVSLKIQLKSLGLNDAKICFEVTDTGIGMTPLEQEKLFKSFSQADRSTTRKYGGTGLGLAISQKLVNLMGSKIEVESRTNIGSSFSFTLNLDIQNSEKIFSPTDSKNEATTVVISEKEEVLQFFSNERFLHSHIVYVSNTEHCKDIFSSIKGTTHFIFDNKWSPKLCNSIEAILKKSNNFHESNCAKLSDISLREINSNIYKQFLNSIAFNKFIHKELTTNMIDKKKSTQKQFDLHMEKAILNHLHVLLVEDNLVNQKIAQKFFKLLGVKTTTVENGDLAVKEVKKNNYDMIFMDCQMPIMDGYAATKAIREFNKQIPIIAMTAHALDREKQKCLQSGMDDHLAKPIILKSLVKMTITYSNRSSGAVLDQNTTDEKEQTKMNNILDQDHLAELFETVDKDIDFIKELLSDFENNTPESLDKLKEAIQEIDYQKIEFFSHKIKGSASNLGISYLVELSQKLEEIGNQKQEIVIQINEVQDAYEKGLEELKTWINSVA